jgi:hypothetical protein
MVLEVSRATPGAQQSKVTVKLIRNPPVPRADPGPLRVWAGRAFKPGLQLPVILG